MTILIGYQDKDYAVFGSDKLALLSEYGFRKGTSESKTRISLDKKFAYLTNGIFDSKLHHKIDKHNFSRLRTRPLWYMYRATRFMLEDSPIGTILAYNIPEVRLYSANWNGKTLKEKISGKLGFQKIGPLTPLLGNRVVIYGQKEIFESGTLLQFYEELKEQLNSARDSKNSEKAIRDFLILVHSQWPHIYSGCETYIGTAGKYDRITNIEADLEALEKGELSEIELKIIKNLDKKRLGSQNFMDILHQIDSLAERLKDLTERPE